MATISHGEPAVLAAAQYNRPEVYYADSRDQSILSLSALLESKEIEKYNTTAAQLDRNGLYYNTATVVHGTHLGKLLRHTMKNVCGKWAVDKVANSHENLDKFIFLTQTLELNEVIFAKTEILKLTPRIMRRVSGRQIRYCINICRGSTVQT